MTHVISQINPNNRRHPAVAAVIALKINPPKSMDGRITMSANKIILLIARKQKLRELQRSRLDLAFLNPRKSIMAQPLLITAQRK